MEMQLFPWLDVRTWGSEAFSSPGHFQQPIVRVRMNKGGEWEPG